MATQNNTEVRRKREEKESASEERGK